MRKIYKSFTGLSLNVFLGKGRNVRVSFDKHSDGGSSYVTDNENIQKGLESHYLFGDRFHLQGVIDESAPAKPDTVPSQKTENALREIEISDLSAAKDYIAENFGVSRTMLRSKASILEYAKANGIEFVGI